MSFRDKISKQFERPVGSFGRVVSWMMSVSNKEMLNWMISKMDIAASDKILEIGYGPGNAINAIAGKLTSGFVEGIDHSELMYKSASRKNSLYISNHKAKLHLGDVWTVTISDRFDIICGSDIHFFWENPVEELSQLHSLLKPGGRIVISFQPRWIESEQEIELLASILVEQLQLSGFRHMEVDYKPMRPVTCVYVSGKKNDKEW